MKSTKARIAAIIAAAAIAAAGSGAAMVSWGAAPAPHHATVADTWTKHAHAPLADTWTRTPHATTQMVSWG
jgi:hypothetical protein